MINNTSQRDLGMVERLAIAYYRVTTESVLKEFSK